MVFSWILLIKILTTLSVVVALSLVAERVSTRMAGILAGFPHGVAIVLYFIGLEQGAEFAAQASLFTMSGLAANAILAYSYYLLCFKLSWKQPITVSFFSIIVFLSSAFLLQSISINQLMTVIITIAVIALIAYLLRQTKDSFIQKNIRISHKDILIRALLATAIVLIITELAQIIGPNWSGLLAGFPVVALPLLIIIHYKYGKNPVATIIKNYPFGLFSLVVYVLTVSYTFPAYGINIGTLLGMLSAVIYLVVTSFFRQNKKR